MPSSHHPRRSRAVMGLFLVLVALLAVPSGTAAAGALGAPSATLPPLPPLPPLPACQVRNHRTMVMYTALAPAVSNAKPGDTLDIYGGCTGTAVTIDRNLTLKGWPYQWLRMGWLIGTKGAPILRIAAGKTVRIETVRLTRGRHTSPADGGAITNAGSLTISGAVFRANIAVYGGAIRTTGPVTVQSTRIYRNAALEFGGAFAILPGGSVSLTGSTVVRSNWAGNGGAAWVQGSLSIDGTTTFVANRAARPVTTSWVSPTPFAGYGGAIFLEGSLTMGPDARITKNTSLGRAGGIWWSNLSPVADYCTAPRTTQNEVSLVERDCEAGTEAGPAL